MRTTIELTARQRAKLLELAGRHGMKGFSLLIQEAVDRYLAEQESQSARIGLALSAIGSLDDESADALEAATRASRESWR